MDDLCSFELKKLKLNAKYLKIGIFEEINSGFLGCFFDSFAIESLHMIETRVKERGMGVWRLEGFLDMP